MHRVRTVSIGCSNGTLQQFQGCSPSSSCSVCQVVSVLLYPSAVQMLSELAGTPEYMAPEVLELRYCQQADIWSTGVVLYELISGNMPYTGHTAEQVSRASCCHQQTECAGARCQRCYVQIVDILIVSIYSALLCHASACATACKSPAIQVQDAASCQQP